VKMSRVYSEIVILIYLRLQRSKKKDIDKIITVIKKKSGIENVNVSVFHDALRCFYANGERYLDYGYFFGHLKGFDSCAQK
jgi:hypothetical protein